jgi:uncharacterized protein YlzI (FlbEa/FlbD family)
MELQTKLIMDSGKEYVIEKHPEDVVKRLTNQMGVVINAFIQINDLIINPSHISSIETYQESEPKKVQPKPNYL